MRKSILIVAAHPDDEALGCGGTIAKFAAEGAAVNVMFLADGVSSRSDRPPDSVAISQELQARRDAARSACAILGATAAFFGDMPDNRLDSIPLLELVKLVEACVRKYAPDTIFTHHSGDLNVDHQKAFHAVETACRPTAQCPVKTIACFEVPSSTEWRLAPNSTPFVPNWHVDISAWLDHKMRALDAYVAEMRAWPHPRSLRAIEHLARWRGASVGVQAAESFMLGRQLS